MKPMAEDACRNVTIVRRAGLKEDIEDGLDCSGRTLTVRGLGAVGPSAFFSCFFCEP